MDLQVMQKESSTVSIGPAPTEGQDNVTSTRQVREFCCLGNVRGCKGMSLHIQTGGTSDMCAGRRRKRQAAAGAQRRDAGDGLVGQALHAASTLAWMQGDESRCAFTS
jgi:hypothetical protein